MAVYTLTLGAIRTRAQYKLRDTKNSARVDDWINDVIQHMTSEIFFDEMYAEGSSFKFTGDNVKQIFDCPEDFHAFSWLYSDVRKRHIEEVSPRELIEEWDPFDVETTSPQVYAPLGRTGAAGVNAVAKFQVKFDSIIPTAENIFFGYYRLHAALAVDADVVLLPQTLLSTIVDGVLMEADSWNDSDQFVMHRDRFSERMKQLKRNQNRRPNRRRVMGRGSTDTRPGRVQFPSNYPDLR